MNDVRERQSGADGELEMAPSLEGFKAIEIVFARYKRDPNDPRRAISDAVSGVYCPGDDAQAGLRKFIDGLKAEIPPQGLVCKRKRHCKDTWLHKVSPVDIYLGVPSYVVIELEKSTGWQFIKGRPGITPQADHGPHNGGLRHVMPTGPEAGASGPTGDGCRILYFSATQRGRFVHQQFHCHIDFGNFVTDPDPIDPDIPNDGGKFPFTNSSPCQGGRCGYEECDGVEDA